MKNFHNNTYNRRRSKRERGVALIAALFALMLISALALAMVFSTTTESAVNANFKDSEVAEYAAHAGIQEGRERLIANTAAGSDYLNLAVGANNIPTAPPAPGLGGVVYITNPAAGEVVQPQNVGNAYFDTELCHDNFPLLQAAAWGNPGNNVPCATAAPAGVVQAMVGSSNPATGQAWALNYKWVRLTQKTNVSASPNANDLTWAVLPADGALSNRAACWDKTLGRQVLLPAGYVNCDQDPIAGADGLRSVYMLTSLAVTPRGTRRMAQAEVAFDPPISMLAAVESNDNVVLNGSLTVTGYDNCSCSCTTAKVAGKDVITCLNRGGHACNGSKLGIFASGSVQNPTGASEQVYSGAVQPYVGNNTTPQCGGSGAGCTPFPYNVSDLVTQYANMPGVTNVTSAPYNWSCSSGSCGTQTSAQFGQATFPLNPPDAPAGMSPQITYIPGNVKLTSDAIGSGIMVVNGDLEIHGGFQFYGLLLVSGSVHFTGGGASATNIYGGILSGTPVTDDTVLGGGVSIQYDYCALKNSNQGQPPRTLAMRELPY